MHETITAASITRVLGGQKTGRVYIARCPAHEDRTPSLSIADAADGKILVHCYAGCTQAAVIEALRAKGLWPARRYRRPASRNPIEKNSSPADGGLHSLDKRALALRIWARTETAEGTPVEPYLRSRGLSLAIPQTLRFHPRLKHPTGTYWPGLVALITKGNDAEPIGIHRTFLNLDGAQKAPVEPNKMILGLARAGAVRLADANEHVAVGEGLETCLSVLQATGQPVWAALSTSGLKALDLPAHVRTVTLLADGDPPGEAAATAAARRWQRTGRSVRIVRAPTGRDFNDVLIGSDGSRKEAP